MQVSQIPTKFPIPFGNGAGGGYIRAIPQASQIGVTPGAASFTDGFPPVTFTPVGAGGVPPFGQDFNGILNGITAWNRWEAAGAPVYYDSAFSTGIGGYPLGAVLSALSGVGNFWISSVDNNTTNPDAGGANWIGCSLPAGTALVHSGTDSSGTANQIVATVSPPITGYAQGQRHEIKLANAITGSTNAVLNGLPSRVITRADGTSLQIGDGVAGQIIDVVDDGTKLQLVGKTTPTQAAVSVVLSNSGQSVSNAVSTRMNITGSSLPPWMSISGGNTVTITSDGVYAVTANAQMSQSVSSLTTSNFNFGITTSASAINASQGISNNGSGGVSMNGSIQSFLPAGSTIYASVLIAEYTGKSTGQSITNGSVYIVKVS